MGVNGVYYPHNVNEILNKILDDQYTKAHMNI